MIDCECNVGLTLQCIKVLSKFSEPPGECDLKEFQISRGCKMCELSYDYSFKPEKITNACTSFPLSAN